MSLRNAAWKAERKLLKPVFSSKAVEKMGNVINVKAGVVVEKWRTMCGGVNVKEEMNKYTLGVLPFAW